MKSITTALANHLKEAATTLTTCWKITRMDGEVYTFTELDRDVTVEGLVYKSTGGFNKSAVKSTGTFAVDNMEVNGFLSDDTIPDIELRNGAFDYAEVEIFIVNYMDPGMGTLKLRYGFFGEVKTAPSGMFLVELRGLIQLLTAKVVQTYAPECKADLGDRKCKVMLMPSVRQQNTAYAAGARVIVPVSAPEGQLAPVRLPVLDPGFESGVFGGTGVGWTVSNLSSIIAGNLNLDPYTPPGGDPDANTRYLVLRASVFRPNQIVSIITGNVTNERVDTGDLTLRFTALTAALELNSGSTIQIAFRNAGGSVISTYSHDFGVQRPERSWKEVTFDTPVPALTRSIRIYTSGYNNDIMGFMATCWDDIRCDIHFPDPALGEDEFDDYRIYGGVEFTANGAGTTGATDPEFDTTLGATTVDGGVTWTAVIPLHMFTGQVSELATVSNKIKAAAFNGSAVAGWYDWGVLEFLSGPNRGRAVEVASYNSTTKEFTLAMPLPYPSDNGDWFRVHTGCDKSREVCHAKFANILNFRGEPDVPGLAQYFKVGGMT